MGREGEEGRGCGCGTGSAHFVHKSSRHAVRSFPSLLRRETFLRALIVSVWLNCRRRIGHGTQRTQRAGSGSRKAGKEAGWGTGRRQARAKEGRRRREGGMGSLSHSLTVVHCTNFFRPDRTTDRRRIWMPIAQTCLECSPPPLVSSQWKKSDRRSSKLECTVHILRIKLAATFCVPLYLSPLDYESISNYCLLAASQRTRLF